MKDLKKIQEFFSKPLEENTTNWPKEVPSRHGDIIFKLVKVMPDRAKYELIDAETGKTWEIGGRVYGTVNQLKASAEDTIKPQGGRQSSQFESVNEDNSFTDYSNNELAAYARELSKQRADAASKGQSDLLSGINKEIEAATRELKKRSQALKGLSRTDVKEQADHVAPMVVKAYKEYLEAKKEGDGEKAYRYYSKKLNNTYSTRADRDAIEAILKKKYGSALEESIDEDKSYARVSKPRFIKDKNNPNFLYVNFKYDLGPGGSSIALGKETMTGQIRRLSSAEAMKQATALAKDLEAKYNLEDIDVYDKENGVVQIFAVSDDFIDMDPNMLGESLNENISQEVVNKVSRFITSIANYYDYSEQDAVYAIMQALRAHKGNFQGLNEATEEDKIDTITMDVPLFIRVLEYAKEDAKTDMDLHDLAEKAISSTKQQGLLQMDDYDMLVGDLKQIGMEENMSLDDQAKAYYLAKVKAGKIDTLPEDPKSAFLAQMTKDQIAHDKETLRRERGLEETAAYIAETIKLGQQLNEELCEKGKRYIKARQAAGEKSSAYLSGRAVRVCKGQIEWPKKGKKKKDFKNESTLSEGAKINQDLDNLLNKIKKDFNIK